MSPEPTPRGSGPQAASPSRSGRRRSGDELHPTAASLLDSAVELLETVPVDGLTIHLVLEHSGVSYGSLYHHFEDISDLVEQAVVRRYTRRLKDSLKAIALLLDSADAADFRRRSEALIQASIRPELRKNRLDRIEALGALQGRPRLVARIAAAQQEVTDAQASMLAEFQRRGWLRADVDVDALSGFLQAVIVGRIVDDVAERHIDPEKWEAIVLRALRAVMYPD